MPKYEDNTISALSKYSTGLPVCGAITGKMASLDMGPSPVEVQNREPKVVEPKRSAWGPMFKDRDHFISMHIA